jgi:hypothetical protein
MRYSDFTNVVATGSPQDESVRCADLRPVGLGAAFHTKENGPQGRGYNGYGFLLASISSATEELPGLGLSPHPQARVWERVWHPAVPLQKSESNWRRGLD